MSKGQALHLLARALGIAPEATMAIGDNLNDLDLVTAAGIGVAMGGPVDPQKHRRQQDGDPRVRAAADSESSVTGTYADDSRAALAIERFVLGEKADR